MNFYKVPASLQICTIMRICFRISRSSCYLTEEIPQLKKQEATCAPHNTYYVVRILPLFFSENKSSSSDFLQTSSLVSIV